MPRSLTTAAAVTGALLVAALCSTRVARAQSLPADVFKIEHFANVNVPGVSADATVRIANPGNTGLRAWGTHVEMPGPGIVFVTETPFQDATLGDAELGVLKDKCGDIFDNGSGHGVCTCGATQEDDSVATAPARAGLCALVYVFDADQQMAACCGCPVSANGLRTLSVTKDLTANPLTGVKPTTGVIKLLSSAGSVAGAFVCDPATPRLPPGSTTSTTSTTTTTTSTTPTTIPGSTSSTTPESTTTTTTTPSARTISACDALGGSARVACELQVLATAPLCDSITPQLQRLVIRRTKPLQKRLARAEARGGRALARTLARMDVTLSTLGQKLARAAKRQRITASCEAGLARQLTNLRGDMAALRP
ncbi:MAG TPA: hypothetical protein VKW76_00095 [Candidatus Binatia bacterium]|nr:hypothetical protein [Candidatus Binatia bacterium]